MAASESEFQLLNGQQLTRGRDAGNANQGRGLYGGPNSVMSRQQTCRAS